MFPYPYSKKDAEAFIEFCETRSIFKMMQPSVKVKAFTYDTLDREEVICGSKAYRFKDAVQDGLNPQKYKYSDINDLINNPPAYLNEQSKERKEIKEWLDLMYKTNKKIRGNIFRSLKNVNPDYLL